MTFKGGYSGKVLHVDLTKRRISRDTLNKELARDYIGGRGFTSKVQYDEIGPDVDPLSPRNKLIFATGPLSGTLAPSSARLTVAGRSPLTGLLGDANSGGHWSAELKFAGYDMLIISGKAKRPTYLWIDNDDPVIKDAEHVWGKTTRETEHLIKDELGDKRIHLASIGPAGENLVRFASVIVDLDHAAGRTGLGAVMGSKNLKAVAVRGTKGLKIADTKFFMTTVDALLDIINTDPMTSSVAPKFGTTFLVNPINLEGGLSTLNWQTGVFDGAEKISGEALRENENILVRATACFACPLRCDRYSEVTKGPFKDTYVGGPEYFALVSFGSKCGNSNLPSIIKANEMANLYGLDVGSTGGIIGFAMECYNKKILSKEDTDGLSLDWGNYESLLRLIKKIAFREGFGNLLADGIKTSAEKIGQGAIRFAMHVKGMDLVTADPRCYKAYSLRYAVASRGADHLRLQAIINRHELDRLPFDEAARKLKWWEDLMSLLDALGVCKLFYTTYSSSIEIVQKKLKKLSELYSSATGLQLSIADLLRTGERITNVERVFNIRMGLRRKDDTLPSRFLEEPLPEGPAKGNVYDVLEPLLNAYYDARGWNSNTGVPTRERLEKLRLEKAADELAQNA